MVRLGLVTALGALMLGCGPHVAPATPDDDAARIVFRSTGETAPVDTERRVAVQRSEYVTAEDHGLAEGMTSAEKPVVIEIFDQRVRVVRRDGKRALKPGHWIGTVVDANGGAIGTAAVAATGKNVFVQLNAGNTGFEVRSDSSGRLVATQTDLGALPNEAEPSDEEVAEPTQPDPGEPPPEYSIDVLLLLDPTLKASLESTPDGLENFLFAVQGRLDEAYLNGANKLPVSVNIVGTEDYTGSTSSSIETQSRHLKNWSGLSAARERHNAERSRSWSTTSKGLAALRP
jgi:hypothetical protein